MSKPINKAIAAGHEVIPAGHADNVETITAAAPTVPQATQVVPDPTAAPQAASTEAKPETTKKEPKFAANLFNGFTLGSTLVQGPVGNKIVNVKGKK